MGGGILCLGDEASLFFLVDLTGRSAVTRCATKKKDRRKELNTRDC